MMSLKTTPLLSALLLAATVFSACAVQRLTVEPAGEVRAVADRVAGWQIANFTYSDTGSGGHLHDHGIDAWTNATFYIGLCHWSGKSQEGNTYREWLYGIGEKNGWKIPANFAGSRYGLYHADEICIGQLYLSMYGIYGEEKMVASTRQRIDHIVANPPEADLSIRNKQSWSWCDALFMAPPVYMALDNLFPCNGYASFMDREFRRTAAYLYDGQERLFFRDDSYFDRREENGEKIFWGRGNGWVVAGLANLLKIMPGDFPDRAWYESLFMDVTGRLCGLQSPDGFWHASLLDPAAYPSPETSATALICYAIAYGINNSLLAAEQYARPLFNAWEAIVSAVGPDGKPGYVQPIGADPKSVTREMTAIYGSGAILMAAAEITDLLEKNKTVRDLFAREAKK